GDDGGGGAGEALGPGGGRVPRRSGRGGGAPLGRPGDDDQRPPGRLLSAVAAEDLAPRAGHARADGRAARNGGAGVHRASRRATGATEPREQPVGLAGLAG